MRRSADYGDRYGSWALVAGASEGLGEAFAEELAGRGLNLLLVARREQVLRGVADRLQRAHDVEVRTVSGDLGRPATIQSILEATAELELGLVVYNAAYAPLGSLASIAPEAIEQAITVNALSPTRLVQALLPRLQGGGPGGQGDSRRRAGIILMSSLAGETGSPGIATYSATKAFTTVLGQALWKELRPQGIDVTVCIAGAIRTPGLARASGAAGTEGARDSATAATGAAGASGAAAEEGPAGDPETTAGPTAGRGVDRTPDTRGARHTRRSTREAPGRSRDLRRHTREAPGTLDPHQVARAALAALGRRPVVVPGVVNRIARFVMRRVLSVKAALGIMAASTGGLTDGPPAGPAGKEQRG